MPSTADNLRTALNLMKTVGRVRFTSYWSPASVAKHRDHHGLNANPDIKVGYCSLGAIAAAVEGTFEDGRSKGRIYKTRPETLTVAAVLAQRDSNNDWAFDTDENLVAAVSVFNDETRDDETVFALFEEAIAYAERQELAHA